MKIHIDERRYPLFPSTRLLIVLLTALGTTLNRGCLTVFNFAVVCMVNHTALARYEKLENFTSNCDKENVANGHSITNINHRGEYLWDRNMQANMLAAQAWGAIWLNIPAGIVMDKYGVKSVFTFSMLFNMITTLFTPLAANIGPWAVFVIRFLLGFGGSVIWSCVFSVCSRWATEYEISTMVALGSVGNYIGPVLAMSSAGLLCSSPLSWPSVFYLWSFFCGVWIILWMVFYTDNVAENRFACEEEKIFLEHHHSLKNKVNTDSTPWKEILFSSTTMCIYFCHFCSSWSVFFVLTFLPTYSKEVLRLDVKRNGIYSALPFFAQAVGRLLFGILGDFLLCKSLITSTKIYNNITFGVPAISLFILAFLDCRHTSFAIFCFCTCLFFFATNVAGVLRCIVFVAPRYSGTVGSITNMAQCIASVIMPYVVGLIVVDGSTHQWQTTMFIGSAFSVLGLIWFQIFGSIEKQTWAD